MKEIKPRLSNIKAQVKLYFSLTEGNYSYKQKFRNDMPNVYKQGTGNIKMKTTLQKPIPTSLTAIITLQCEMNTLHTQYVKYLLYHFAALGPQTNKSGQTMSGVLVQNQDWSLAQGTHMDLTTVNILRMWLFTATLVLPDQILALIPTPILVLISTFQVYLILHSKSSSLTSSSFLRRLS